MTTAIIAKSYGDARVAAAENQLANDWVYPHDAKAIAGVKFDRIMFVSGYAEGSVTVELIQQTCSQAPSTAPVFHYKLGTTDFDMLIAPFVEPGEADTGHYAPRHAARDKLKAVALLAGVLVGGGAGIALVVSAVIAGLLPW